MARNRLTFKEYELLANNLKSLEEAESQESEQNHSRTAEDRFYHDQVKLFKSERALAKSAMAAWRNRVGSEMKESDEIKTNGISSLGQHTLAEFECSESFKKKLDESEHPEEILKKLIIDAADASRAHKLLSSVRKSESGNISGIVVIEESHFSVHYRKDTGLIAIDVYTCGKLELEKGFKVIENELGIPYDTIHFKRGVRGEDGKFIPGLAAMNADGGVTMLKSQPTTEKSLGQHLISEFYLCDADKLDSPNYILQAFKESIKEAGGEVPFEFAHEFTPQGVSAVIMGDGYHLTIHDWPELDVGEFGPYAAIDFCNFNDKVNGELVMELLTKKLDAKRISTFEVARGTLTLNGNGFQPSFPRPRGGSSESTSPRYGLR